MLGLAYTVGMVSQQDQSTKPAHAVSCSCETQPLLGVAVAYDGDAVSQHGSSATASTISASVHSPAWNDRLEIWYLATAMGCEYGVNISKFLTVTFTSKGI